jgi:hypothetical protein
MSDVDFHKRVTDILYDARMAKAKYYKALEPFEKADDEVVESFNQLIESLEKASKAIEKDKQ